MTYTKDIARHDRVTVDGTDASNAFRAINLAMEDSEEDVTGFSVTGAQETLPGTRSQGFEGEVFYTPESYALLYPLFRDRTEFEMQWQPDGLVDPTREVWFGNVTIRTFGPAATVGGVRVMPFSARASDAAGIVATAAT